MEKSSYQPLNDTHELAALLAESGWTIQSIMSMTVSDSPVAGSSTSLVLSISKAHQESQGA